MERNDPTDKVPMRQRVPKVQQGSKECSGMVAGTKPRKNLS